MALMHQAYYAVPAGQREEMKRGVEKRTDPLGNGAVGIDFFARDVEGPGNQERAANDILAWHKAPIATVEAHVPIVAHCEVVSRRHHHVITLHILPHHGWPAWRGLAKSECGGRREVVPVI